MAAKVTSLKFNDIEETVERSRNYVAVVTSVRGYKLCWMLNKLRDFEFLRKEDMHIFNRRLKAEMHLQHYEYVETEYERNISLYSNITDKGYLIRTMNVINFFMVFDNYEKEHFEDALQMLKNIPQISFYALDKNEIKPFVQIMES